MKKQVSFQTFSYFYKKAQHCADKESFIEEAMSLERDDWALGYSAEEINDILNYIYELTRCSVAALREKLGLTKVAMADIYITSKRTLLAWEKANGKYLIWIGCLYLTLYLLMCLIYPMIY